jgi:hypothetical protein
MAKFVLTYKGGSSGSTPEEQQKMMSDWMNWFGTIGESLVDPGSPLGQSVEILTDGSVSDRADSELSGYSIIEAADIDAATEHARSCPVLASGGSIDLYEAIPIG